MDINTCFETTQDYRVIAYYSHLIPLIITLVVSSFVYIKSKRSLLSGLFALFTVVFCLWLLGDVIVWTSNNYDLVTFFWAPLDYINICFYLLGAYFFSVLVRGKDLPFWQKAVLVLLALPAWLITISFQTIPAFYQPQCEALNSDFLTEYKLVLEIFVVLFILVYSAFVLLKGDKAKRKKIIIVSSALLLFFGVFSVTEYISSQTGVYEINLYSLFVLPVFIFMIIYAVTSLEIFQVRLIGFQLLAYVLIIMVGSQFFFLENTTDKTLTVVTFLLSLGFGVLLVRSGQREEEARKKVEGLASKLTAANLELKELDRQKDELISIVSHQLATPVTSVKWYLEMLLDGDSGELNEEQKKQLMTMQGVTEDLVDLVGMILDVSRIQLGRMKVDRSPVDLGKFFTEVLAVIEPKATVKKQQFIKSLPKSLPTASLDKRLMRMTLENLLSNAVKYTPEGGKVELTVTVKDHMLRYEVKDSGCGIPKEEHDKIFGKLFRATNVRNTEGNGLGLFAAKGAAEAQGGKVWFESEPKQGTTFYVEVPIIEATDQQALAKTVALG